MRSKKTILSKIRSEFGGVDMIQFVVALMIIGIAAAAATFSLYIGRGALDNEWRKKRALEIARDEIEYWTAFVYEGQNGVGIPENIRGMTMEHEMVLDERSDGNDDDIWCRIQREPVELHIIQPGTNDIESYLIKVNVIWEEPTEAEGSTASKDTVSLHTWMIFKDSISGSSSGSGGGAGGGGGA